MAAIKAQMTDEDKAYYEKIGEGIFSRMQVVQNPDGSAGVKVTMSRDDPRDKYALGLVQAIKAGLAPEDLDAEDAAFAEAYWGSDWKDTMVRMGPKVIPGTRDKMTREDLLRHMPEMQ